MPNWEIVTILRFKLSRPGVTREVGLRREIRVSPSSPREVSHLHACSSSQSRARPRFSSVTIRLCGNPRSLSSLAAHVSRFIDGNRAREGGGGGIEIFWSIERGMKIKKSTGKQKTSASRLQAEITKKMSITMGTKLKSVFTEIFHTNWAFVYFLIDRKLQRERFQASRLWKKRYG